MFVSRTNFTVGRIDDVRHGENIPLVVFRTGLSFFQVEQRTSTRLYEFERTIEFEGIQRATALIRFR